MRSATKSAPRFSTGDWVSYLVGFRRVLAQVVEDRGPLGMHGRRIYQVQTYPGEDRATAIEVPEAELGPAPAITTAELARENGFSTQDWPRQAFHVAYKRAKAANEWTASVRPIKSSAVPPMVPEAEGLKYTGDENVAIVRVDLEYDPRLADPRTHPFIWTSLTESARRIADEVFRAEHPKARIIPEPALS